MQIIVSSLLITVVSLSTPGQGRHEWNRVFTSDDVTIDLDTYRAGHIRKALHKTLRLLLCI